MSKTNPSEKRNKRISVEDEVLAEKILENLLRYAVLEEAETILIEKDKDYYSVNLNIQGVFKKIADLPEKLKRPVFAKIKERASLDSEEESVPQFGEFKIYFPGFKTVLRVSVIPTADDEKVIIEICNLKSKRFSLRTLGIQRNSLSLIERNLETKKGAILVIGDFNAGKTTTMYSFLDFINKPDINVSTIENNLDLDIPFVNQSIIDRSAGFDHFFATSSILRQDPDVVMIDDANNREAAHAVLDISERSHLVFASIFSKNILTTLDFLKSLDVSLLLFANNVNLVVNQRLALKLCPYCLSQKSLTKDAMVEINKKIDIKSLLEKAKAKKIISKRVKKLEDLYFYKASGCPRCRNSKSNGQIGIFEILEMTENVRQLIKSGHISGIRSEIKNQAGFLLEEDALLKASQGIIDINEVLKMF